MEKLAPTLTWKYKIVEKLGVSIRAKVTKSNPWSLEMCENEGCKPCTLAGKPVECRKRNIVYETKCVKCEENPETKLSYM